jgi:hypothetical protein
MRVRRGVSFSDRVEDIVVACGLGPLRSVVHCHPPGVSSTVYVLVGISFNPPECYRLTSSRIRRDGQRYGVERAFFGARGEEGFVGLASLSQVYEQELALFQEFV